MAMREAYYYRHHAQGIACLLCPKGCIIGEGQTGFCRTRKNSGGKLYALNYGACSSYALDAIEKKPLYHFYPGKRILSLGTWGCNFACQFCQNWQLAQAEPQTMELSPDKAVAMAKQAGPENIGIAYTYSEPSVWYEYVLDTARQARKAGLKNVLVTNGFINTKPLEQILPYVDAMNIDVKAFSDEYYRQICAGRLEDVKRTVEQASLYCHVEITTLLVPGLNDSVTEIESLVRWLGTVNSNIPLHFSRYFPNHRMLTQPTPLATLERSYRIARNFLNYVYLGNVGGSYSNTYCPACFTLVLDRTHQITSHLTQTKKCPCCGRVIDIIGDVQGPA